MPYNKDADVYHVGANPQAVDPNETPEDRAAREEVEADIHAPEVGKAAEAIVFDDKGNPRPMSEMDDKDVQEDRAKDAAEERAQRRKDGGDKR